MTYKVLVCGGRDYLDKKRLYQVLDDLCIEKGLRYKPDADGNWLPKDIEIISGMARGADTLAADWAIINYVKLHEYHALWDVYGRKAGPIRNQKMLDEGKPDLVIAFPGGHGTAHMKRIAKAAGVEVREIA